MSGPSAREPAGWQAQKSAATRNLIVNATVRCLVEVGYGRTTTQAIASQAGLSRGAMLHHFPLKSDAVRAAVERLYASRLQALERGLEGRSQHSAERIRALLQAAWQQVRDPSCAAELELRVAARTDVGLAAVLAPAAEVYAREWRRLARAALPPAPTSAALEAALEVTRTTFEGLALLAPAANEPGMLVSVSHALELLLAHALRGAASG